MSKSPSRARASFTVLEEREPSSVRQRSPSAARSLSILPAPLQKSNYLLGVALLLIVVVLWTTSNFVTQDLFDGGYEKPFLVTYLNTSAFALYLIPVAVRVYLRRNKKGSQAHSYQPIASDVSEEASTIEPYPTSASELPPLSVKDTAWLAGAFCVLWFLANWTVNASLDFTTVASATILSSTSGFFTMIIGRMFRVERFSKTKIATVLTSFAGVILVSLSDSRENAAADPTANLKADVARPFLGDILALFSAAFYALYVILLKVAIRDESRIDMQLFFGFVGVFNAVGMLPLGLLLHVLGVEKFELPTSKKSITALLINMAITWFSDYLYVLAMLKTTPLVVTVGLSLTIPFAVVGDFILDEPIKLQVIAGAVLVLASFVVLGLDRTNTEEAECVPEGRSPSHRQPQE